jgi:hypothetical protein
MDFQRLWRRYKEWLYEFEQGKALQTFIAVPI